MERQLTKWSLRRWLIPGPLIAALLLAAVASSTVEGFGETYGWLGLTVGPVAAGVMVLRRSVNLEPRERRAWHVFGLALFAAGTGVLAVGIWSVAIGDPPAFGATDIFFLTGYALLVTTLLLLSRADSSGPGWVRTLLDALIGGIALSVLVWNAFFHDLVDSFAGAPLWEMALGLLYPVLDIAVIVGVMVLVLRRSHFHLDMRLVFMGVAMALQVTSDFVYFSRGVGRTFAEAQPVWPLLLVATAFWLSAAALVDVTPRKREFPEENTPLWALAWPYLLAIALLATHVMRYRTEVRGTDDVLLLDALILIGALIVVRQLLEIVRNRGRVEQQRSELVASVSHELRTPLTAIVGYLNLLEESGDDFPEDARKEMITEASGEASHMSRLVNDLVMLARGSNTPLPLELDAVSVLSLVTSALRTVDTGDTIVEDDVRTTELVRVDRDRLQQALTNLIGNAVRYGGTRALLVAENRDDDLVISVHDDGPGVPTRYEAAIWQRFERGAHRLDAATPGLGVGLAIVQAVAESHGGAAGYRRSELLGGACFYITIPDCVVRPATGEETRRQEPWTRAAAASTRASTPPSSG